MGDDRRRGGRPARRRHGFTLIELMVTVALIALLAAVAYPSYRNSVQKARRVEAKSALTDAAQRLERYYTENNTYERASFCVLDGAGCTTANQVYGPTSENGYYRLRFAAGSPTATRFVVVAVPQASQADDRCGSFTLDQAGTRGVVDNDGSTTDATSCW